MTIFPKNNLPTGSLNWSREVEKAVNNLESTFKSAEVNNVTRDAQLQNSYKRLDAAVTQLATTTAAADQAQLDAITALNTANTAQDDAITALSTANTANTNALNALQDIIDLGNPDGPSINATNITGGTITGITVQTASSGTRSKLSGSNIEFFSSLYSSGTSRVGYIQGDDGGDAGLYIISDQGSIALDAIDITLSGDATVTGGLSVGDFLEVTGAFSPGSINTGAITSTSLGTGAITASSLVASGTVSGNTISGTTVSASGTVSGATVSASNFSGTVNTSIASNTTGSFTGNVFINTSGNMFRSTAGSSREIKNNINPYEFDTNAFISVSPVTFNYKADFLSDPAEAEISQLGFIVEDFEEAGLGEYLSVPANEVDNYKSLRYDKLYMFLHKVVQTQHERIEELEARLTALEDKVQ